MMINHSVLLDLHNKDCWSYSKSPSSNPHLRSCLKMYYQFDDVIGDSTHTKVSFGFLQGLVLDPVLFSYIC